MKIVIFCFEAYLIMGLGAALGVLLGVLLALFQIILWSTIGTLAITGAVVGGLTMIAGLLIK